MDDNKHKELGLEYAQINENFRFLADVRFKLIALLPALGGAAVFLLAHLGLEAGKQLTSSMPTLWIVLFVSLIGFFANLGITLYDQRNSELYNALIHRAKYLEKKFKASSTPGGLKANDYGGQFSERPPRRRELLFFQAGHDIGLALIYGPLLGAWLFPILFTILELNHLNYEHALHISCIVAGVAAVGFTWRLILLDKREMDLYHIADAASKKSSNKVD